MIRFGLNECREDGFNDPGATGSEIGTLSYQFIRPERFLPQHRFRTSISPRLKHDNDTVHQMHGDLDRF